MTDSDLATVIAAVRRHIDPGGAEHRTLAGTTTALKSRVYGALADLPVDADALQVGNIVHGAWLSGGRDIDLSVRFPADFDHEELEAYGLEAGHAVLPDGHEEYAERPYVKGDYDGFDADLVPCYGVPSTSDIRLVVDRAPFRSAYLTGRLDDNLTASVRVFKRFLKGIDAYGSSLRTEGFSGYLAELLVVGHSGFEPLLRVVADQSLQVGFDPEDHGTRWFPDPLVVIDPTNPERNVVTVCSTENVVRLRHYAHDLLSGPWRSLFFRPDPPALDTDGVQSHLDRRGTTTVAVIFDCPDLVDDQLYPQLGKSLTDVADGLDRRSFDVFQRAAFVDTDGERQDEAALFTGLSVAEHPAIERHKGPPVHVRQHAEGFYGVYGDREDHYGPFLDGDRYVVECEREFAAAADFFESDALFDMVLGKHVESTLREDGYDVLADGDVATLAEAFSAELGRYFAPRP